MKQFEGELQFVERSGEFDLYRTVEDDGLLLTATGAEVDSAQKLKNEFLIAHHLDSEFVIRPRELGTSGGVTALLLDDRKARPLAALLGEPFEIDRFLDIAIQLARCVRHVHESGIVHRNISPDNIMVDSADRVWLTGFYGASRLARERPEPMFLGATTAGLAYVSPEQTGRMNRSVDSRTDLYSLGVVYYEMLSGRLPFTAKKPSEWAHCHIARSPRPLPEAVDIPAVEAIILTLLAKAAEDRYQTAAAIEADLELCRSAWLEQGAIAAFPLHSHAPSELLLIPEKLYGRDQDIHAVVSAFERVAATGVSEWIMVSGYSGMGKSSVVNDVHKVLTPKNGLFAAGKFDQFKRDIPYATIAQAFASVIHQILGSDDETLDYWRDCLQEAVGPHGQIIIDLIPDLESIIGAQPAVSDLPSQEAKTRFQSALLRFFGAFARADHPLVLFLDDLQWLDAATLEFLNRLAADPELRHLLLIGAYRDNEIDAAHPLTRFLASFRQSGAPLSELVLRPLALDDVVDLVSDVLRMRRDDVAPLAQLVHEKTAGNPFFSIQFLTALGEEQLLTFSPIRRAWSWDTDVIDDKGFTHNVVDLMSRKVDRLPAATIDALQWLSCIAMSASVDLLCSVSERSTEEIHAALAPVVASGLLRRSKSDYRFVHDRIREAAYSTIPPSERPAYHLKIGRALADKLLVSDSLESIFEVVNQLNQAGGLIIEPAERLRVAQLNLAAGRRAKASIAYGSALIYFTAGCGLLPPESWDRDYRLAFDLELQLAECEFLTGNSDSAEKRLSSLAARTHDRVDQAAVVSLQVTLLTALDRSRTAVETCLGFLRDIDIDWPVHPTKEEAWAEYRLLCDRLNGRPIESLLDLPLLTDPEQRANLGVFTAVLAPAFFTDANLVCLVLCRMANLSIQHGNTDASALAYAYLGMVVGPQFDDYPTAFSFGKLGLQLVGSRGLDHYKARVHLTFGAHVIPWVQPLKTAQPFLRRAFDEANEAGDLTYAGFSSCTLVTNRLGSGDPLDEVEADASTRLAFVQKAKFGLIVDIISAQLRLIKSLRGDTSRLDSLNGDGFDELAFEAHLGANRSLDIAACWYWILKAQARFFGGRHLQALDALLKAEPLLWTSSGHFELVSYHFFSGLIRAACHDAAAPHDRPALLAAINENLAQLALWEKNAPETYENRTALLTAELARIEGRDLDAMRLYEKAINSARNFQFVQNEAIACELASRFYKARGITTGATAYLNSAYDSYLKWGALAKANQLLRENPDLEKHAAAVQASTPAKDAGSFDLETVVRTSEAVSSEFSLNSLMNTLMALVLEHAGAQRGLLILAQDHGLQIEVEARTRPDGVTVTLCKERPTSDKLPLSIVNFVARTQQSVILDDAQVANPYSMDPYIATAACRSLLCIPLVKQTKLIAILFLENNLSPSVFTPARVSVLKLLASQAAISLENASLEEKDALVEALQKAQSDLVRVARLTAFGELVISIAHEVNQPLTAIIMNADVCLRWLNYKEPALDEAKKAAERVVQNGRRAAEVIKNIRALAVKSTPEMQPVNINEIVREVLTMIQGDIQHYGVKVETALSEHLLPAMGNRIQIQQVLLNLATNAIEAMGSIKTRRVMRIASEVNESGSILISVTDTGPGFDPDGTERMFEALVTTKPQGMGMGLSISKSIVEAHGGRLWAELATPRGASFRFTIPAVPS